MECVNEGMSVLQLAQGQQATQAKRIRSPSASQRHPRGSSTRMMTTQKLQTPLKVSHRSTIRQISFDRDNDELPQACVLKIRLIDRSLVMKNSDFTFDLTSDPRRLPTHRYTTLNQFPE